jgi:hypothetical protein
MTESFYKIMVLGPFAPVSREKSKPDFVHLDLYSLDEALAAVSPVLYMPMPARLCPEGAVAVRFNRMKDFNPSQMKKNMLFSNTRTEQHKKIPPSSQDTSKNPALDDILSMVDTSKKSFGDAPGKMRSADDAVLQTIFSHEIFQSTESAWRSLAFFVKNAGIKGCEKVDVSICPVSRENLEEVLGHIQVLPHDQIPNLLLIDMEIDNTQPAVRLLEKIVLFSEKMMLPVCLGLKPAFFGIADWALLHKISYIRHHLEDMGYTKFRKIRQLPAASWTIVCCNRFAVRNPHPFETMPLMASPVWAVGTLCAKSIQASGWPMGFTNYVDCFLENLPVFSNDHNSMAATQALFSEDRVAQLLEAGITPVVGPKDKDTAFIPEAVSLAGDPIRFQMFFNRIIGILMATQEGSAAIVDPEREILSVIKNLFTRTGHPEPENLSVIQIPSESDGQRIFEISFVPPGSVPGIPGKIHFSFRW